MKRVALLALLLCCAGVAQAVDANSANRAQLEQLRHVGPPLADAILVARDQGGAFKDWTDLMARVRGIRDAKAAQLSEAGLTVGGAPYLPPMPSSSISK
jgi:competence protein ComEA